MHKLTIESTGGTGATSKVLIDGEESLGLTGLTLTLDVEDVNRAELRLAILPVEFTGNAELSILPETAALLVKLGWTAPEK
ncbi:hypothetical protein [Arthrobacter bambusae]|uniref:hypothetical protein n=1 Tax=Arthrobacter bambusae TaxID=1338426 RepID=UPI00278602CE|nr:hypothetical protein [Arthrobacter bambusae]MDQ0241173.1 hypothetical protein [Arthrobacter bambusae]